MAPVKSAVKVAVIGAGAAGLCAGRHLQAEPEKFVFDIFERQDDVGGTWRYSERVGQDNYGFPVHSSMYKNLMTNLPKEVMAFPDFPFPDYDGKSFLHHSQILQYLKDYAQHYGLYKYIKFLHIIENVKPLKHSDGYIEWSVSYWDVVADERQTKIYDAVMVCNGHFSVPYVPEIPGLKNFKGLLMHSHDYRDPDCFKDMKVVALGAGPSGIDISIEVSEVAKEVVLSHNSPPKTSLTLKNFKQENGIEFVNETSVTFFGGKNYECDAILLCTGYLNDYPFLDPCCNVQVYDQRVSNLYLHTFHIDHPTLAICGILMKIAVFPIFNQQVKVFIKYLKRDIIFPSSEVMRAEAEKDFEKRMEAGFKLKHAHNLPGEWQWEFDEELCRLGNIDPVPEVVRSLFRQVHQIRLKDWVNYRKTDFRLIDDKSFIQIN